MQLLYLTGETVFMMLGASHEGELLLSLLKVEKTLVARKR